VAAFYRILIWNERPEKRMSPFQILALLCLAAMNIAGFAVAFADKQKARRGAWRIRERTFVLLALAGGGLGVLVGFLAFRHKTKHAGLMLGVIAITAMFCGIAAYFFNRS
jgi:uncharacterized membrane protein YsdA (DUF1294 family)